MLRDAGFLTSSSTAMADDLDTLTALVGDARAARRELAAWYAEHRRPLPWRSTNDPYAIWLSEIMAQQTTIAAVIPYWHRFLEAYPDLEALASAREEDVLRLWSGLGYYHRARNLLAAARLVRDRHGGRLPTTADGLRSLPGVGQYTAAAVASIVFGAREAAIDGNVVRVLTRLAAAGGDPSVNPLRLQLQRLAQALLDPEDPGAHNQAVMELGARVCTPRSPSCGDCPWSTRCRALRASSPERYPETRPRQRPTIVTNAAALVSSPGRGLLLRRIPAGLPNVGLLELPTVTLPRGARPGGNAPRELSGKLRTLAATEFERSLGLGFAPGLVRARIVHGITRYRITVFLLEGELTAPAPRGKAWRWSTPARARDLELTGATRRLLEKIRD